MSEKKSLPSDEPLFPSDDVVLQKLYETYHKEFRDKDGEVVQVGEPREHLYVEPGPYQQFLQSEAWARIRAMRLTYDRNMCHGCGMRRAVLVHHIWYPNARYHHLVPLWCLVSLCQECHDRAHTIFNSNVPWMK